MVAQTDMTVATGLFRIVDLCRTIFQAFVLHASIIKPLSEAGKLKLTSDMTLLEFSVNQLLSEHKLSLGAIGDDFRAIRSFRFSGAP
jgi:hypothetical protein